MVENVTGLELFAFVILPIGIAGSAWVIVLLAERRGAAKVSPREKGPDSSKPL